MLSIRAINKRFGDVHALNNVSLDLKPGLFGLLGPNGAGKSTLMRTLATLQKPDEGTITYNGVNIVDNPDVMRSTLGYLPQDFGVYPRMSALALLDHIAILKGITNKKAREEQIMALLENVNLITHRTASVATYSGGMRQRFGVAQALLGNPKVLIVDEPTAGLDPFERQRFLDLLSEAGENKIILLSTHIVEDVRDLCPDMAIMGKGQIIARGAPESLIDKIRGKVWRKTIEKSELDAIKDAHKFLNSRYLMGGVVVSILSESSPGAEWEKGEETLEDGYFAYLNGHVVDTPALRAV
ncbi:ABC-type multidrug transport system ATPase subunit [Litorimonas taeanensis]|uniref:ABC-type multidrug transport system ATPase subunit n=1 Tax=Litorimonas taeanensis TaxID=568099 RepID=A0A420WDZ9_9PROT|nr:ABC transporter ATP-binding protein [Litorimonas taeanensis]RKQ69208.1 ABC-type multidrug transport system ATPase subunit [Litorimonas taeanensis]